MSDSPSFWRWASNALRVFCQPIVAAAGAGADDIRYLLTTATATSDDAVVEGISSLAAGIANFADNADGSEVTSAGDLLKAAADLITAWDAFVSSPAATEDLVIKLLEYLLLRLLWNTGSVAHSALALSGIVDESKPPGERLILQNVKYLWRPRDLLAEVYSWGTTAFNAELLLQRVGTLARSLAAPVVLASPSDSYGDLDPDVDTKGKPAPGILIVPLINEALNGTIIGAGFVAMPFPGKTDTDAGIALVPYGVASFSEGDLSADWAISLKARCDENYGLVLRPSGLKLGKLDSTVQYGTRIDVAINKKTSWLLDLGDGFSISAEHVQLAINAELGKSFGAKLNIKGFATTVAVQNADGFLATLLPPGGLTAKGDLTISWSSDAGLHFDGGAGFKRSIPLHLTLGPISLSRLALAAEIAGSPILTVEGAVDISAQLGPIAATIQGLGVRSTFDIVRPSDHTGEPTFGPIRGDIGFRHPDGLGIAIDAGLVAGGGFISFDDIKKEYSGVFSLTLADVVQINVIGILDTVLPNGKPGYSFLLIVSVDFPPIQLGFGFTLNGVGGDAGVNRTIALDALRAGFRAHTLDSVLSPHLSPKDLIAQAPQIISNLSSFFPEAEGRYVFGPKLDLGWETFISLSVTVILEVPEPIRLVLLGLIDAWLPAEDEALVLLHIDVLGTVDFGTKKLTIDGSLYDSRVLDFPIKGDMALRLNWGDNPNFLCSFGGFNAHFSTAGLDVRPLNRLSISIGDGDNPRISANSYMALTSNTAQFGANVEAYASVGGFNLHGDVGFDVLFVFSPFSFEFDFAALFDVSYQGNTLAGLNVSGMLSGFHPYHFKGTAKIEFLIFSVSASVDLTWGDKTPPAPLPPKPVLPDLWGPATPGAQPPAMQDARNWSAALPDGMTQCITFSKPKPGDTTLRVHPMGTLNVREKVVPLDLTIERYQNAAPADANYFRVSAATINTQTASIQVSKDSFAAAQFFKLSDADKLSRPSFEPYDAVLNLTIGTSSISSGVNSRQTVVYEERYIYDLSAPSDRPGLYKMPADIQLALTRQGAAAMSPLKNTGLSKYRTGPATPAITTKDPSYVVAGVDDLSIRSDIVGSAGTTYFQARTALRSHLVSHPEEASNLQILPLHEATP